MTMITFVASWHGELSAGIRAGSEEITITFKYGTAIDSDTVDYWRESIREYYDGATVRTLQEEEQHYRLLNDLR